MTALRVERVIAAPPARVFAVFTDLENAARNVSGIRKLERRTPGPVAVGTRYDETREMFGRDATVTFEVTALAAPKSYAVRCDASGACLDRTFTFTPVDGGTRVSVDFGMKPTSFLARLMSPLGRLMVKMCAKAYEKDLDDLQRVAEAPK